MTLTPAYGRDYKSLKAAQADWDDGKDFVIADYTHPDSGRYINKQDAKGLTGLYVRYARLTKIGQIKNK